jgi:hypothetical protein
MVADMVWSGNRGLALRQLSTEQLLRAVLAVEAGGPASDAAFQFGVSPQSMRLPVTCPSTTSTNLPFSLTVQLESRPHSGSSTGADTQSLKHRPAQRTGRPSSLRPSQPSPMAHAGGNKMSDDVVYVG